MSNPDHDDSPAQLPAPETTRFSARDAFAELLEPGVEASFDQVTPQGQLLLERYADTRESPILGVHAREEARAALREHRMSGLFEKNPPRVEAEGDQPPPTSRGEDPMPPSSQPFVIVGDEHMPPSSQPDPEPASLSERTIQRVVDGSFAELVPASKPGT